jgi:hypothetical protein
MDWHEEDGILHIEMRVPTSFLRQFSSAGDVFMQLLGAIQARGLNIGATESMRTSVRGGFSVVSWSGSVTGNPAAIMPAVVKELTEG